MESNLPEKTVRDKSIKSSRQLVEKMFIDLGFTDENPSDLDMVNDLLQMWLHRNDANSPYGSDAPEYTAEQWALLNDEDVQIVLNRCKEYYEPKEHMTNTDLRLILEKIASGNITRQGYDYKNGATVYEQPTFGEMLQAIKLLQPQMSGDDKETVQFINNIGVNGTDIYNPDNPVPKPSDKPNMDNVKKRIKELEEARKHNETS